MTTESNEQYRAGFEAKPCPFCGGEAEKGNFNDPAARCQPCGTAFLPIDLWNRRAKRETSAEPSAGYGRVDVVGDLVRNLLTLDQTMPIHAAFHVDFDGARRCRTRPVTVSRERVIDGKWVDGTRKDVPYAAIVWAKPQADELAAGALPDEAKSAALTNERIRDLYRKTFPIGPYVFTTGVIQFARAIEAHARAGAGSDHE